MDLQALTTLAQSQKSQSPIVLRNETADETQSGSNSSSAATSLAGATNQSEEFNTFIHLLTAQVKNQDPLAPLDSTQFVEQLATFTNLELQAKNNQILENIAFMLAAQIQDEPESVQTPTDSGTDTVEPTTSTSTAPTQTDVETEAKATA